MLVGAVGILTASKTEQVPARKSLEEFPYQFGQWEGRRGEDFSTEIMNVLGVDEYINRVYASSRNSIAGLYIGYYESQRQGDTIHSPMNCLPGAGWEPVSRSYLPISVVADAGERATIVVNRYVIQKGLDQQVVLYWYQSHGRVVANEYRSKVLMVYDAVRLNRTDAALVRVISPSIGANGEAAASANAVAFVQAIFPTLSDYLPE